MTGFTLKMEVEAPENLLSDVMITAFDGNYGGCISYGCFEAVSYDIDPDSSTGVWKAVTIRELPEDGASYAEHSVSWQTLVLGMQRILDAEAAPLSALAKAQTSIEIAVMEDDGGEIDSALADLIVQFGLFGEEKYG